MSIATVIVLRWAPQPDITVHELAICLPYLVAGPVEYDEKLLELLPQECRRHFAVSMR